MTPSADCARCGEAFEPEPGVGRHPSGFDEMCPPCRHTVHGVPDPLAIACLDDGAAFEAEAAADLRHRLGIAGIDEPECARWDAVAAAFDALDTGLASRGDLRALLLSAYEAGGAAAREAVRDGQDTDAWEHLLSALRDADLTRAQRDDIQDHAAAHAIRRVNDELTDDEGRADAARAARTDVTAARETLHVLRDHHGTPALPASRLNGELAALDARLAQADHCLTEALP